MSPIVVSLHSKQYFIFDEYLYGVSIGMRRKSDKFDGILVEHIVKIWETVCSSPFSLFTSKNSTVVGWRWDGEEVRKSDGKTAWWIVGWIINYLMLLDFVIYMLFWNNSVLRHNLWQASVRLARSDDSDTEGGAIVSSSTLTLLNVSHNRVCCYWYLQRMFEIMLPWGNVR